MTGVQTCALPIFHIRVVDWNIVITLVLSLISDSSDLRAKSRQDQADPSQLEVPAALHYSILIRRLLQYITKLSSNSNLSVIDLFANLIAAASLYCISLTGLDAARAVLYELAS